MENDGRGNDDEGGRVGIVIDGKCWGLGDVQQQHSNTHLFQLNLQSKSSISIQISDFIKVSAGITCFKGVVYLF